jgi:hypothetical protein
MLYFMHIPKTAGMFIRNIIQDSLPNTLVIDDYAQVAFLSDSQLNSFDAIVGHVGNALLRRILEPKTIIFLRNPVDRLLSMYCYWRFTLTDDYTKFYSQIPFLDWLESGIHEVEMERDGGMIWQLAVDRSSIIRSEHHATPFSEIIDQAYKTLEDSSFIGFQETIVEDTAKLCSKFNLHLPKSENRVNESRRKIVLTPKERKKAEAILENDMKLFGYAKNLKMRQGA